jgi:hypothetical protein
MYSQDGGWAAVLRVGQARWVFGWSPESAAPRPAEAIRRASFHTAWKYFMRGWMLGWWSGSEAAAFGVGLVPWELG